MEHVPNDLLIEILKSFSLNYVDRWNCLLVSIGNKGSIMPGYNLAKIALKHRMWKLAAITSFVLIFTKFSAGVKN